MKYGLLALLTSLVLVSTVCSRLSLSGDSDVTAGIAAQKEGRFDLAVECFDRALAKGVARYERDLVLALKGDSLESQAKHDLARAAYDAALVINPKSERALTGLGLVSRVTGREDEAEKYYKRAIASNSDYAEAHSSLATLYLLTDRAPQAISSFETAIRLDPELAVAHGNYALALAMVGRFDDAHRALERSEVLGYKNVAEIQRRIEIQRTLQR